MELAQTTRAAIAERALVMDMPPAALTQCRAAPATAVSKFGRKHYRSEQVRRPD